MATEKEYLDLIHKKIQGEASKESDRLIAELYKLHKVRGFESLNLPTTAAFICGQLAAIVANMKALNDEKWAREIAEEAMKELGEL